ncbi:hypothetical protein AHF37_02910 [Paragonimus kellicotti]|nr:hypothetical protein AHF37_02910 [Paragonimus kellicotti]
MDFVCWIRTGGSSCLSQFFILLNFYYAYTLLRSESKIPVDSPEGIRYRGEHAYVNSASHIAILDPVTGEQKVMWMHLKDPKSVHEVCEFYEVTTDPVDDLIVLTDDDDEDVDDSDDDNTDPDCFIFDPDATYPPNRSSTAIISSRRPLRPTGTACVSSSASVQPPVCHVDPRHAKEVDLEIHPLLVPKSNEEAIELVVRLPNGTREVLRLASSLPLVDLRCYFESRGFPRSRYELVRLYPRCNLSSFSESTTLSEAGLARKDTIFIQER